MGWFSTSDLTAPLSFKRDSVCVIPFLLHVFPPPRVNIVHHVFRLACSLNFAPVFLCPLRPESGHYVFCVCAFLHVLLVGDGFTFWVELFEHSLLCSDSIDLHVGSIIHWCKRTYVRCTIRGRLAACCRLINWHLRNAFRPHSTSILTTWVARKHALT